MYMHADTHTHTCATGKNTHRQYNAFDIHKNTQVYIYVLLKCRISIVRQVGLQPKYIHFSNFGGTQYTENSNNTYNCWLSLVFIK